MKFRSIRRRHMYIVLFNFYVVFFSFIFHWQNILTIYIWVNCECFIRNRNCLPFARTWIHQRFFIVVVWFCALFIFVVFLVYPILPLSLACPFFICLCLWLAHSSFVFVSGLSILHLSLSLACPFFICLCLWLVHSSFAFGFL